LALRQALWWAKEPARRPKPSPSDRSAGMGLPIQAMPLKLRPQRVLRPRPFANDRRECDNKSVWGWFSEFNKWNDTKRSKNVIHLIGRCLLIEQNDNTHGCRLQGSQIL
jgi:hypothetical protein